VGIKTASSDPFNFAFWKINAYDGEHLRQKGPVWGKNAQAVKVIGQGENQY